MSWINDLTQQAKQKYIDIPGSPFQDKYKKVREAQVYGLSKAAYHSRSVTLPRAFVVDSSVKTDIENGVNLLDSFTSYARVADNEVESALLYGIGDDAPTNYWTDKRKEYTAQFDQMYARIQALAIPAEPTKPAPQFAKSVAVQRKYSSDLELYTEAKSFKEEMIRRIEATKFCTLLWDELSNFELNAFTGNKEAAQSALQNIKAGIREHGSNAHYGSATACVLAKLLQVKTRVDDQFGEEEYDVDSVAIAFANSIQHGNDPVCIDRIQKVREFVNKRLNKADLDIYTPWFLPRFGRWLISFITKTSSNYVNTNSEKQAWSLINSDIMYHAVPAFFEEGNAGVTKALQNTAISPLASKLNVQPNAGDGIGQKLSKYFSRIKNRVFSLFGAEENNLDSVPHLNSPNVINQEQAKYIANTIVPSCLHPYTNGKPVYQPSADVVSRQTKLVVPYPKWPSESLSEETAKDPAAVKNYAEQVGNCIHQGLVHGDSETRTKLKITLAKFLIPALFRICDEINIRSSFTIDPENFVGLGFYKDLLDKVFALELPANKLPANIAFVAEAPKDTDLEEAKRWKQMYRLKTVVFDKYNSQEKFGGLTVPERTDLIRATRDLATMLWNWDQMDLPAKAYPNDGTTPVIVKDFYFKLSDLRYQLRSTVCNDTIEYGLRKRKLEALTAELTCLTSAELAAIDTRFGAATSTNKTKAIEAARNQKFDLHADKLQLDKMILTPEEKQSVRQFFETPIQNQVKKLQEEAYLNGYKCTNDISAILEGYIYNSYDSVAKKPSDNIPVTDVCVRLFAALNAIANNFIQHAAIYDVETKDGVETVKYNSYKDFIESYKTAFIKIERFITTHSLDTKMPVCAEIKTLMRRYAGLDSGQKLSPVASKPSTPPSGLVQPSTPPSGLVPARTPPESGSSRRLAPANSRQ